jgi:hypothetical protein
MKKIPTDNYIRLMLDPVSPEILQPSAYPAAESNQMGIFLSKRLYWRVPSFQVLQGIHF